LPDRQEQLQAALADRYVIEHELGRGGMATVYLAHDVRHDRPVALKVLRPELAQALGPERFLREIRLAARLQHLHILPVFDSGETADQLWYAMPYIEGESLRERLVRERQLAVEDALRLTREIADALDYAHSHGIVHRDVKPENILLSQGHALVADFGIARALQEQDRERLTETGLAIGTLAYMSPEQSAGERHLDGRTDIYSLGVVLYEMLAGEPPFSGPTAQAVLAKRLSGQFPPVRLVRPATPEFAEQAIAKALAPVATDRYSTMAEFAQALAAPAVVAAGRGAGVPAARRWRATVPVLFLLSVVVLIGLGILLVRQRTPRGADPGGANRPKRLAVLPFKNLGDSADAYFAEGITDEIRGKLASVRGLEVIARASSERYQGVTRSPEQIGRELGVGYLLTGTIRWAKPPDGTSRVRVSPELIRTASGVTSWQEPFEAPLTDVFQVQAEIAGRVARALDLALGDSAHRVLAQPPTADLTAYTLYLRGRFEWNTRTRDGLLKAVDYFRQAIERDSTYARAHAGLSDAYLNLADYNFMPAPEAIPQARVAAKQALALDSTLAEAHTSLAAVLESQQDWLGAEREYRRAIALDPSYPTAHHWYALLLPKITGRQDDQLREIRRAQELDPLSLPINDGLGTILYLAGQYDAAVDQFQKTLELKPDYPWALQDLALTYAAQGRYDEAIGALRRVLERVPDNPEVLSNLAYVFARAGRPKEARAFLVRLNSGVDDRRSPIYVGLAYAALGQTDSAFYWLEWSDWKFRSPIFSSDDPRIASLRGDPRFPALLKQMGLR
jgi:TolB-like protein/Tfp pilus assembly protein PilF